MGSGCGSNASTVGGGPTFTGSGGAGVGGQGEGGNAGGVVPTPGDGGTGGTPGCTACGSECCTGAELCVFETCVEPGGECTTSNECHDDRYCYDGQCIPYGVPEDKAFDDTCERSITIDAVVPAVQCRWTEPPVGDVHPEHVQVMSTPVVVDFDMDSNPNTLEPSIVFSSFPTVGHYQQPGVLRIIDGADCTQQYSLDADVDQVMSPASPSVGDLDGDGRAEIVAVAHLGGLLAFRFNETTSRFEQYWRSGTCDGSGALISSDFLGGTNRWSGASIHDLDDDGSPEVIYGGVVYGADGCILSDALGFRAYSNGTVPVIADVDEDGIMELLYGNGIYEWNGIDMVAESYFNGNALTDGFVAVAELGDFPVAALGGADYPEVAVISQGQVRVHSIDGAVVFGNHSLPGLDVTAGPPTIADFDGDGRREFATAGGNWYVVYDLDCVAGGDPAACNGAAKTDGILWKQPSQDHSSSVTGSSVFDFDADGKAEAVYADECFLRIYDGATGEVKYSAARASGTTYENPVIVDVDGDFNTEIVSSVNDYAAGLVCPATDPLFPSSEYERGHGIVVLKDELDRWASSRPVWNQHAYAVTHVGDHGEIPASSAVARNWDNPGLNNFRQNVQGDLDALGIADLTVSGEVHEVQCEGTVATLEAVVCNRGTLPMASGTEVAFREGAAEGPELCWVAFAQFLDVGQCQPVSCEADLGGETIEVYVVIDPDAALDECHEGNNVGHFANFRCGAIPQ